MSERGVVFPLAMDGQRSTTAVARGIVADALRDVDPTGARDAEREPNWRTDYVRHYRRLVEAGLRSSTEGVRVAMSGGRS